MTRYHFDVCEGDLRIEDIEGMELISVQDAWKEAAGFIADRIKDIFIKGANEPSYPIKVDVREAEGLTISLRVTFAANRSDVGKQDVHAKLPLGAKGEMAR